MSCEGSDVQGAGSLGNAIPNVCHPDDAADAHNGHREVGEADGTVDLQCEVRPNIYTKALRFFIYNFRYRYCFVEKMRSSGILHQAMYDIMQEWYKYIEDNVYIQADLIGMKNSLLKKNKYKIDKNIYFICSIPTDFARNRFRTNEDACPFGRRMHSV